jgi:hypothetical protein
MSGSLRTPSSGHQASLPRDIYVSRQGNSQQSSSQTPMRRVGLILAGGGRRTRTLPTKGHNPALIRVFRHSHGAPRAPLRARGGPVLSPICRRCTSGDAWPCRRQPRTIRSGGCRYVRSLRGDDSTQQVPNLNNVATGGYAGAITAALFLRRFVTTKTWLCTSIFSPGHRAARPGRPEGAECPGGHVHFMRSLCAPFVANLPRRWAPVFGE